MVDQTQRLSRYRELIQELNETKKMEIARRTVELFFSFDIVNSSLYKTINYTGWYNVIISLFKEIQASVMKLMPGAEMWRVLGDEIVFIIPIKENKDFFVYTDKIFEILNIFVLKLKNGQFFDELEIDNDKKLLMKMQNVISLKAAAWIAIVGENVQQIERYDNLLERYKLREGYGLIEFLGNDIDAGFRIKKEMYYNVYNALNKILSDQNLIHKFVKMDKIIEDSPTTQTAKGNLLEPKFFLRLHCVAVCYDKSTKKILIMKRSSKREKYPDKWEFGCAKAVLERSLNEQIEQEYYNDFGVKIKVVCDEEREDKQPIPLALYEVESEQGKDKGVISLAEVVETYKKSDFKENEKHSEVRWISREEVDTFKEDTVKDFKNTLKLAFAKMEEMYGNTDE